MGWPWWTWLLLALAPLAAVATYRIERRTERRGGSPLLPPSLLALPSMRRGIAFGLPFFLGFGGFMFVFALTVQNGLHQDALHSGLMFAPYAVTFFIGALLTPALIARYGRKMIAVGGLVQAAALTSLVMVVFKQWPGVGPLDIIPSLAVAGFAGSLVFVSLFRLVLADVPPHLAGIGSGIMVTLQQSSYALGVAVLGTLFVAIEQHDMSGAFGVVVGVVAGIALIVGVGNLPLGGLMVERHARVGASLTPRPATPCPCPCIG